MLQIDIQKKFRGPPEAFEINVNFEVEEGHTIALFGESGAGKTSILRMISGLLKPDSGRIVFNDSTWYDETEKIVKRIQEREVGMVFQDSSLFPNMTVFENLRFAAQGKWDTDTIENTALEFQLEHLLDRKINNLSGGQKQRVELTRAILRKPKILLLDEPFNGLDHKLKSELRIKIIEHIRRLKITTIIVSHDVVDIMSMADYTYEIDEGSVLKYGKPLELFASESSISNFHITGDVIKIEKGQILSIVSILIGKQIVKVAAHPSEIIDVMMGDRISINSKAFNPILTKIK